MSHALPMQMSLAVTNICTREWSYICLQTLIRKVVSLKEQYVLLLILHFNKNNVYKILCRDELQTFLLFFLLKQKKKKKACKHQIVLFATCYKKNQNTLLPTWLTASAISVGFCIVIFLQVPFYTLLSNLPSVAPPPYPQSLKAPKKSLMEWLDEFRFSEIQREDEEGWFYKSDLWPLFSKKILVILHVSVTGSWWPHGLVEHCGTWVSYPVCPLSETPTPILISLI